MRVVDTLQNEIACQQAEIDKIKLDIQKVEAQNSIKVSLAQNYINHEL